MPYLSLQVFCLLHEQIDSLASLQHVVCVGVSMANNAGEMKADWLTYVLDHDFLDAVELALDLVDAITAAALGVRGLTHQMDVVQWHCNQRRERLTM